VRELRRTIAGRLGQKEGEKAGKEGNAIKQASQLIFSRVRLTGQICIYLKCTLTRRPPMELPKLELPSRATRGLRMNKVDRLAAHVQHTLSKPHE